MPRESAQVSDALELLENELDSRPYLSDIAVKEIAKLLVNVEDSPSLSESHRVRREIDERLKKLRHRELVFTRLHEIVRPVYSAAVGRDIVGLPPKLLKIRLFLTSSAPFYPWARERLLELPLLETSTMAATITGEASALERITELMNFVATETHRTKEELRRSDETLRVWDKVIAMKLAKMLSGMRRRELQRRLDLAKKWLDQEKEKLETTMPAIEREQLLRRLQHMEEAVLKIKVELQEAKRREE